MMARIKIKDLPADMEIDQAELRRIRGGARGPLLPELGFEKHEKYRRSLSRPAIKWVKVEL